MGGHPDRSVQGDDGCRKTGSQRGLKKSGIGWANRREIPYRGMASGLVRRPNCTRTTSTNYSIPVCMGAMGMEGENSFSTALMGPPLAWIWHGTRFRPASCGIVWSASNRVHRSTRTDEPSEPHFRQVNPHPSRRSGRIWSIFKRSNGRRRLARAQIPFGIVAPQRHSGPARRHWSSDRKLVLGTAWARWPNAIYAVMPRSACHARRSSGWSWGVVVSLHRKLLASAGLPHHHDGCG